jgi:hypothetical protein
MALAASMTLVACDKNENEMGGPTDMQPKRVTVKLPNLAPAPGTRAVGDAMQNGSQVELTDFKVFFLDASGAPITVPQYNGQDQQVYFSSDDDTWEGIAASGKDLTFHFLPYQTAKVVVVGNQGNIEYATLANQTEDVLNDTENGHPKYTLYGEDELTEGGAPDNESHENVYQASVNLEPRVSRFEIYGFEYELAEEPATNKYTSVKLDKIALNNYYTKYDFVTKTPSETGKVFDNPDKNTLWSWVENAVAPWADVLSAEETELTLTPGQPKAPDGGVVAADNGEGAENIITYGLAHVADKANNPELLLTLHGTTADGTEEPIYLRGTFTNSPAFNSGKIYRVLYSFSDADFTQPERCVELNVKVANWTVVPVTPEF